MAPRFVQRGRASEITANLSLLSHPLAQAMVLVALATATPDVESDGIIEVLLSTIRQIASLPDLIETLSAIVPLLPDTTLRQKVTAEMLRHASGQQLGAYILGEVAIALAYAGETPQSLDTMQHVDSQVRGRYLERLAEIVPQESLSAIATAALSLPGGQSRVFLSIVSRQAEPAYAEMALRSIQGITHEPLRARELARLRPYLTTDRASVEAEVREIANRMPGQELAVDALVLLLAQEYPGRGSLAAEVFAGINALPPEFQALRWEEAARYLPQSFPIDALAIVERQPVKLVGNLCAIAPFLVESSQRKALEIAYVVRAWATQTVGAYRLQRANNTHPDHALATASTALCGVGRTLSLVERDMPLAEAWQLASAVEDIMLRTELSAHLIPFLNRARQEASIIQAFIAAKAGKHGRPVAGAIARLAPFLPDDVLAEALAATHEVRAAWE